MSKDTLEQARLAFARYADGRPLFGESCVPTLARLQALHDAWQRRNYGYVVPALMALGVGEETGEAVEGLLLLHAELSASAGRLQHGVLEHEQRAPDLANIRDFMDRVAHDIVDTAGWLISLSTAMGLDFGTLLALGLAERHATGKQRAETTTMTMTEFTTDPRCGWFGEDSHSLKPAKWCDRKPGHEGPHARNDHGKWSSYDPGETYDGEED